MILLRLLTCSSVAGLPSNNFQTLGVNLFLLTNVDIYEILFRMDRTIVAQLNPTQEQDHILARTLQENTAWFNVVAREGFETGCSNGIELHKRTYYLLHAQYPDLPAQLVCASRVKATEAVKSALTWKRKHAARYPKRVEKAKKKGKEPPTFKPVRCPVSTSAPIRYDACSYWVKWESMTASLATVAGRLVIGFTVPKHAAQYINSKVCSADLCFHHRRYFLHIVVSLPAPVVDPSSEVIVGLIWVSTDPLLPLIAASWEIVGGKNRNVASSISVVSFKPKAPNRRKGI